MHTWRLIMRTLLPASFALLFTLSGCGAKTSAGVGSGGQASLHCTAAPTGHGIDTTNYGIACTVSGAASGDTSFSLSYALARSNGSALTYGVACQGTLSNGQGTCSQTVVVIAPNDPANLRVTATLAPSKKVIGPMHPTITTAVSPG